MESDKFNKDTPRVNLYDAQYSIFRTALYSEVRREIYDEDFGQNSWVIGSELRQFGEWLGLRSGQNLLDIACGSGGPAIQMAKLTGCKVQGIDNHAEGIANANTLSEAAGLAERVRFQQLDASQALPFQSHAFDAILCIDAINHLSNRAAIFAEWKRVLQPYGRVVFTDPTVVTGWLSNAEIATRSATGFFLFVPPQENERLLQAAGLKVLMTEDLTAGLADNAQRYVNARVKHEAALRKIEGDATYEGQNEFFRVTEKLARERRLSRFAFLAEKIQ